MDDQGEHIVLLARHILDAELGLKPAHSPLRRWGATAQLAILFGLLALAGGGATAWWLHESDRPLDRAERFELDAMMTYAATLHRDDDAALRRQLTQALQIATLDSMTARDLPAARNWLARHGD